MLTRANDTNYVVDISNNPLLYNEDYQQRNIIVCATFIEHIVAVSEAHDSGLCSASSSLRRQFAADLLNLTLAAPEVNRCNRGGKCGYDSAEWQPAMNRCWFAARIIAVKRKYALTVDAAETTALRDMLAPCTSTDMQFTRP